MVSQVSCLKLLPCVSVYAEAIGAETRVYTIPLWSKCFFDWKVASLVQKTDTHDQKDVIYLQISVIFGFGVFENSHFWFLRLFVDLRARLFDPHEVCMCQDKLGPLIVPFIAIEKELRLICSKD